jgi:hypothetical protein
MKIGTNKIRYGVPNSFNTVFRFPFREKRLHETEGRLRFNYMSYLCRDLKSP